jgi:hypothetical protein
MKRRNITQRLFGLIFALIGLMVWVVPVNYALPTRSWHPGSGTNSALSASGRIALDSINSWSSNGPDALISSLTIDPGNSKIVYAGSRRGVFKSTDGGATWGHIGLSSYLAGALAINPVNPNVLYAGTTCWCPVFSPGDRFLFKSTNGGATWSNSSSPVDFDVSMLVMDPTSPNTLYAGSVVRYWGEGGIILWKSTDGGTTWNEWRTGDIGLASYGFVINPVTPQTLYAPGDLYSNGWVIDSGLFKSIDGGANWSTTGLTKTLVNAVAIDPSNPETLYAGTVGYEEANQTFRGLLKSNDGGASWFAINNGLTDLIGAGSVIMAILIDPKNPDILYAGTSGSGVFRSIDGGAYWQPFNDGLTDLNVTSLAMAPDNPNTLYAGTSSGVFKIDDNVSTLPAPIPRIISASISGKKLIVRGENLSLGAVILINGEEQITKNDGENPKTVLIGEKAGKKIKPGDRLQVRNPNGSLSQEFIFTSS